MTDDQFRAILKELRRIYVANVVVGALIVGVISYFVSSWVAHLF
jgi:hypothetical protein